jgi:hypothetical protein
LGSNPSQPVDQGNHARRSLGALTREKFRSAIQIPIQSQLFVRNPRRLENDLSHGFEVEVGIGLDYYSADLSHGVVGFRGWSARLAAEFAVAVSKPGIVVSAALGAVVAIAPDLGSAWSADAFPVAADRGQWGGVAAVCASRSAHIPGTTAEQVVD